MRKAHRALVLGAFSAAIVLLLPLIGVSLLVNQGNLFLVPALITGQQPSDLYGRWSLSSSDQIQESLRAFELAKVIAPQESRVQWGYGRAAMAAGQHQAAAKSLGVDSPDLKSNPILYLDTVTAQIRAGNNDKVTAISARFAPPPIDVISDTIALAYMREARSELESQNEQQAIKAFEQALAYRPYDLYTNFSMWRFAGEGRDREAESSAYDALVNFPVAAVDPREPELLDLVFEIFPDLASDKLWGHTRSQNVAAFWTWQMPEAQSLEDLLQSMVDRFQSEGSWAYYLGELHDRRGQREMAEAYYRVAVSNGVQGPPVEQRLTRSSSFAVGGEGLMKERAATLLGLSTNQIRLGSNAVADPFMKNDRRLASSWSFAINQSAAYWSYAAGEDLFEQSGSMRIADLWWPVGRHEAATDPFAQFETSVILSSDTDFLLSVWYRIDSSSTTGGQVFFGTTTDPLIFVDLSSNDGQWTQMMAAGAAPSAKRQQLILRNLGAASVWFSQVEVRPVDIGKLATPCRKNICTRFFP